MSRFHKVICKQAIMLKSDLGHIIQKIEDMTTFAHEFDSRHSGTNVELYVQVYPLNSTQLLF